MTEVSSPVASEIFTLEPVCLFWLLKAVSNYKLQDLFTFAGFPVAWLNTRFWCVYIKKCLFVFEYSTPRFQDGFNVSAPYFHLVNNLTVYNCQLLKMYTWFLYPIRNGFVSPAFAHWLSSYQVHSSCCSYHPVELVNCLMLMVTWN